MIEYTENFPNRAGAALDLRVASCHEGFGWGFVRMAWKGQSWQCWCFFADGSPAEDAYERSTLQYSSDDQLFLREITEDMHQRIGCFRVGQRWLFNKKLHYPGQVYRVVEADDKIVHFAQEAEPHEMRCVLIEALRGYPLRLDVPIQLLGVLASITHDGRDDFGVLADILEDEQDPEAVYCRNLYDYWAERGDGSALVKLRVLANRLASFIHWES